MPYIDQIARTELDSGQRDPRNCGELNYKITMMALKRPSLEEFKQSVWNQITAYADPDELRYQIINDVIGALIGSAEELNRRNPQLDRYIQTLRFLARKFYVEVAAPYEDLKMRENGDLPYE
jgi:hypothetical protein